MQTVSLMEIPAVIDCPVCVENFGNDMEWIRGLEAATPRGCDLTTESLLVFEQARSAFGASKKGTQASIVGHEPSRASSPHGINLLRLGI